MVNKLGCVYVIFDKVNQMYLIGETGRNGKRRLDEHLSDLRIGKERNKSLQESYDKNGESEFVTEVIIETINHVLCELVLMELFLRVGKAYNERKPNRIKEIERGELEIPVSVYEEVENYLHKSHIKSTYYNQLLIELEDMRVKFESKSEKIYNRVFKKKFLLENYNINQGTKRVVRELFKRTYEFEVKWEKDLYNFTFEEAEEVLMSFEAGTLASLRNLKSTLCKYLDYSIEQGASLNKYNYYKNLSEKNATAKYLDKDKGLNSIFSKDEIMAMGAENAQDGVILGLLFDGASHKNEFEELINLTTQDVNNIDSDERSLTLKSLDKSTGEVTEREIPMSYETAILVKGALDQNVKYTSITSTDNVSTARNYKIAEGNHVLRGLRGKATVKSQIISQRILRIAEINDEKYLNATTITYSGQLDYVNQLIEEENDVLEVAIDKALYRFGMPINTSSQFYLKKRIEKHLEFSK